MDKIVFATALATLGLASERNTALKPKSQGAPRGPGYAGNASPLMPTEHS
jgi:hypothetical protein